MSITYKIMLRVLSALPCFRLILVMREYKVGDGAPSYSRLIREPMFGSSDPLRANLFLRNNKTLNTKAFKNYAAVTATVEILINSLTTHIKLKLFGSPFRLLGFHLQGSMGRREVSLSPQLSERAVLDRGTCISIAAGKNVHFKNSCP